MKDTFVGDDDHAPDNVDRGGFKTKQVDMVTCVSCGILFPSSFLLNAEGGAVAIGTDCYCSQACAEGQVVRPFRYMVFDEFDFMRGDR